MLQSLSKCTRNLQPYQAIPHVISYHTASFIFISSLSSFPMILQTRGHHPSLYQLFAILHSPLVLSSAHYNGSLPAPQDAGRLLRRGSASHSEAAKGRVRQSPRQDVGIRKWGWWCHSPCPAGDWDQGSVPNYPLPSAREPRGSAWCGIMGLDPAHLRGETTSSQLWGGFYTRSRGMILWAWAESETGEHPIRERHGQVSTPSRADGPALSGQGSWVM